MLSQSPPLAQVDPGPRPALVLWVRPAVSPQPRLAIRPRKGRCRCPPAPQRTLRARPNPAPPASVYLLVLPAADLPSRTAPIPPRLPPPVLSPLMSGASLETRSLTPGTEGALTPGTLCPADLPPRGQVLLSLHPPACWLTHSSKADNKPLDSLT